MSAFFLAELEEEAGVPPGWLNVVAGSASEIGDVFVEDPRVKLITFTGSGDVGWGLAQRASLLLHEGARPVAVTQYNRLAYNSLDSSLRITADHNLMYFALPWEARADTDDAPSPLGSLLAMEPNVIVEMKWYGELPHWAVDLHAYLKENTHDERPSKFIVAMRWLLGETDGTKKTKKK